MSTDRLPSPLCPTNKSSFAYKTVKDRLPVTITKAIDFIYRSRNSLIEKFGANAGEDCKDSIERLSQLRYELSTDKPLRRLNDTGDDSNLWNEALDKLEKEIQTENLTWFKAPWLFTECYMYRRIREAMLLCSTEVKDFDPFDEVKREGFHEQQHTIFGLISVLCPIDFQNEKENRETLRSRLQAILQVSLWSNKNDLSLTSGSSTSDKVQNLIAQMDANKKNVLANDTDKIVEFILGDNKKSRRFDILLDNSSVEVVSDLVLSDFLLRNGIFDEIHLHAKCYSWFVSDVTPADFEFTLTQLQSSNSYAINQFLKRLRNFIDAKKLVFVTDPFWTLPYSHNEMKNVDAQLYAELEKCDAVLLKGDLHYRKLVGDLDWPLGTPYKTAIRNFHPSSLIVIRTLKSDLAVQLDETDSNLIEIRQNDQNWMVSGNYGIIQFVPKSN